MMNFKALLPFLLFAFALSTVFGQVSSRQLKDSVYTETSSFDAKAHFNSGFEAYRLKDFPVAVRYYLQAIKEDSLFAMAVDNLAMTYSTVQQLDSAIYYFNRSIAIYPKGTFARVSLAALYSKQHRTTEAIRLNADAIRIDPDFSEAHIGLCNSLIAVNQPRLALPYALKAMELFAKERKALLYGASAFSAGVCFFLTKDIVKAKELFDKAAEYGVEIPERFKGL